MRITSEDWLQAQYSVLGSMLISPEVVPRVLSQTSEQDYSGGCLSVYRAIYKLFSHNQPVDPVSVNASLGGNYSSFLLQLMEVTPSAANIEHYIALCREQSRILAVRELGNQLSQADSVNSVRTLLEQAGNIMATQQAKKTVDMSDGMRHFLEKPNVAPNYLSWPLQELNERLFSGPGDFIILGAEPSVGKTALALQCAWHWARDRKVGFFSFETSPEKLFDRLMSSVVGIPMPNIKNHAITNEEWERVCRATQEITSRTLDLIPASGMKAVDIRAKILEGGYQLIIVDYLQLISTRGGNRYEQVTNISIDLHNMAQEMGVTVVALSQLSRSDEERTPKNSDLRESGQLEQDADVIIMLKLEKQAEPSGFRKLFVTKNKEGELFMTVLAFDGKYQRFTRAPRTGETISKYVADGKKARQKNKSASQQPGQMTILPDSYPVPF